MDGKKFYIAVILWQGCIDNMKLCSTMEQAKAWFKEATGADYDGFVENSEKYEHKDWVGSEIFELKEGMVTLGLALGRGTGGKRPEEEESDPRERYDFDMNAIVERENEATKGL